MSEYLKKIAAVLESKLGMPAGQKVPAQTLQVLSQTGDSATKREARGVMNLKARGGFNHPKMTSKLPQKMPHIKEANMNIYLEKIAEAAELYKEAKIEIKPSHKGLLHKNLGEPEGKKLSVSEEEKAKHSSDPAVRKRATFALNARKWHKG